ncbi:alpha/beta fold hydrolase [uncultured Sphingomonas sp.]|uniref:alpha/beta fold hydrolase n=1 Tax=uncultured Sphingomonas sp. TaxID=158754 RepID=UPI0035CC2615
MNTINVTSPRRMARATRRLTGAIVATALGMAAATSPSAAIAQERSTPAATGIRYKSVAVDGITIFYREAGDPAKPTILLLHGFPASSHEFRTLMPLLSARFHLVAPDYPGFGFSDAPSEARFAPTFANLTTVMDGFVRAVGLTRFTIYMQDFGGPVGFRLAVAHPDMVDGLIIQNANAYEVSVAADVLKDMRTRAAGPLNAKASAALEGMLSLEGTKFQYLTGVRDPANVDPTSYRLDSFVQALPQQHRIQRALIVDYYDNVRQYPAWHAYLKARQPKTLILWGKNDPIFLPAGADAYRADLPKAEVHLLNTGHFALEEDAEVAAKHILRTFGE